MKFAAQRAWDRETFTSTLRISPMKKRNYPSIKDLYIMHKVCNKTVSLQCNKTLIAIYISISDLNEMAVVIKSNRLEPTCCRYMEKII